MSLLVAGAFAVGTVLVVHMIEERLLSAQLGRDLDRLLKMETMDEWRAQPRPDQLFYFTDGPDEFALPADLRGLEEGFQEVFRGEGAFHAMLRRVDGREYVLLQDQSDFERRERLMYVVVLVGFLLSVLLAALLGWLLARRVMAPVVRLARQVRHRDQLLAVAPPLAPDYVRDEVGELAAAFDEALSQLRQALTREQLFTSDVSHELRTPLMVLAGSCELLLENPALEPRARRQVERIARASEEMRELVQTFLQLAREQSAEAPAAPQASLRQVADELVAHWREPVEAGASTTGRWPTTAGATTPPSCVRCWATCCATPGTTPTAAASVCSWRPAASASRTAARGFPRRCARRCSSPSCAAMASAATGWAWGCRWCSGSVSTKAGASSCARWSPMAAGSACACDGFDVFFTPA